VANLGPDYIAREMGLEFTLEEPTKSKMRVYRFTFKFPEQRVSPEPSKVYGLFTKKPTAEDLKPNPAFQEVVAKVTAWRKKVGKWIFDPSPPGEQGIIVAAELTWGNWWKVNLVNRANRKAMKRFWSGEAMARRAAVSQPTPEQGLFALREQLAKYGIKKPDAETLKLKAALERAAAIVAVEDAQQMMRVAHDGNNGSVN
jgi:hypothetical protein